MLIKKKHFLLTAFLIAVILMTIMAVPVSAASASGDWKSVKIKSGNSTYNVSAFVLNSPAKKCTSFDLSIDVTMNGNTSCKNWQIWIRKNGTFTKASTIYLPNGDGYGSKTVSFSKATDFDAVAVTPTIPGGYSWSLSLEISNIVSSGNSSAASSASSAAPTATEPAKSTSGVASGDWKSVKIKSGNNTYNISAFVFNTPVKKCTSFDLAMDVTMNGNTSCKKWQIWIRKNGTFVKASTIYLPNGSGYGSKTVTFSKATDFDAVALTPTVSGGYSWSLSMEISNIVSSGSTAAASSATQPAASTTGIVNGDWKSVKIKSGNSTYNVSAFVLDKAAKKCTSFDLAMDVTMNGNTSCKKWQIWIRKNGTFVKASTIYLPNGSGYGSKTVTFSKATDFDAVALTPTIPGGYSWSLSMTISNLVQK